MQEHVRLEVSLEIIMAEISKKMFQLSNKNEEVQKDALKIQLDKLIELQENAYKGDRNSVNKILNREFE